ncbi:hypothetical protein MVT30_26525, partial [Salmonella sp. 15E51]
EQEIEKNPLLERDETANEHFSFESRDTSDDRGPGEAGDYLRGVNHGDADESRDGGSASEQNDHWLVSGESTSSGSMSETFDSSLENIFPDDPGT